MLFLLLGIAALIALVLVPRWLLYAEPRQSPRSVSTITEN